MDCPHCGASNQAGRFCMRCRKRLAEAAPGATRTAAAVPAAPRGRQATPIVVDRFATLTFLQAGYAGLGAVGAAYPRFSPAFFTLMVGLAVALLAISWGFKSMKPWGRTLMIPLAILGLLGIPLGTILYGFLLVYLFKPEVKAAFGGGAGGPENARLAQRAVELWKPLGVTVGVINLIALLLAVAATAAVLLPLVLR